MENPIGLRDQLIPLLLLTSLVPVPTGFSSFLIGSSIALVEHLESSFFYNYVFSFSKVVASRLVYSFSGSPIITSGKLNGKNYLSWSTLFDL